MQIITVGRWALGVLLLPVYLHDVSAQNVYKTVNEQGNVVYTDRPPANAPVEILTGLDISRTDSARIASQNEESRKQAAADNEAARMRADQNAEAAGMEAKAKEQRKANCEIAKQRVTKYSEAQRLYYDKGDGEREYLSDAELDTERSKAVRSASEWCD
ncbi:MAG: DUF4124 domain-containing protein [Gammaproteobacteria bacterium]|nr:DUF4124 domain-containing protein [Gammaproteobacteria bacterium]MCP4090258.1 DUF4124 domain-containing protein [Gammaproteobacteria bacterium]MCP4276325.1 DUF4124 domain-containing protein [Gammaproteobacteria bacterium]MCP4831202.1 DUF4124 domain-containing protein [Gammaproteobacteria bacterium]MCP4930130.1 DUF4124 domain-containing protein [Gammaproteobacteria bacterium]